MFKKLAKKVVLVEEDELKALLWATAYGFFIMFSYYIMRPVRDEISAADRGNLQILWTAVFFAMLVAVPAYSWVASRLRRGVFVPLVNRFFIACLVGFYLLLVTLPESTHIWIDRTFYIWLSVFSLFVVAVMWGFIADCFTNEQGKRLFGFIAVGSSLGGLAGSTLTASVAEVVPVFALLLMACVPLEGASWAAKILDRDFAEKEEGTLAATQPLPGDALSGIKLIFRSPYLTGIAFFFLLMTFSSTILYFQQSFLVGENIQDSGARTVLFARMDMAVNLLTIFFQVYLSARIMKWLSVGIGLAVIPAAVFLGFTTLGVYPTLWVLIVVQVLYRAGRYGITRPAREVLYTVVSREEKYKSKAFIDAAVYRGGDLVSGWIYAGLAWIGLSIGAISLVAAPFAAIWAILGLKLGTMQEERRENGWEGKPQEVVATQTLQVSGGDS